MTYESYAAQSTAQPPLPTEPQWEYRTPAARVQLWFTESCIREGIAWFDDTWASYVGWAAAHNEPMVQPATFRRQLDRAFGRLPSGAYQGISASVRSHAVADSSELPTLDRAAFPVEFHDPAAVHDAEFVTPAYFVGYMDPLAADIINFEDPLTRLALHRRNTLNPFDYPHDVTFAETQFNHDLHYIADAVRAGDFPTLHDGLQALIEGCYKVNSELGEEIADQALVRRIVQTAAPVIVPWDEGLDV